MKNQRILSLILLAGAGAVASADEMALLQYCESLATMSQAQLNDVKNGIQARLLAEQVADNEMSATLHSNQLNAGALNVIKSRADQILNKTRHLSYANYTLTMTGANLNIRHGATEVVANNGLGNVIIGTNEWSNGVSRTGSLNLILGARNSYTGRHNVVAGYLSRSESMNGMILSGFKGHVKGDNPVLLTGTSNYVSGMDGFLATGAHCFVTSTRGAVLTGEKNIAGTSGMIVTGFDNLIQASGFASFIGTGYSSYSNHLGAGIGAGHKAVASADWKWIHQKKP